MYVQAQLLNGYTKPLWYTIPKEWQSNVTIGSIITVPLRNKKVSASVIFIAHKKPHSITFNVKDALSLEPLVEDSKYQSFIQIVANYHQINSVHIIKRLRSFIEQKSTDAKQSSLKLRLSGAMADKKKKAPSTTIHNQKTFLSSVTLTDAQQKVCNYLLPKIEQEVYAPTVIHGVTGSGKTECYKKAILHALEHNKTALLLLPEVSLSIAFEVRLKKELPQTHIFGFHSGKTTKEKKELWRALQNKQPILIIGVHLPLFLPIFNLGLIIVDEEHEAGYQEKKHPKINTKDAAIMRAHQYNIPIILGSATPTIATLCNVKKHNWKLFELHERFGSIFPVIEKVSLLENKQRRFFWITQKLEKAIAQNLNKGEQSIIFINRRGISFFVQCKQCSFIFCCNSCSVSLTLHANNMLRCHYCGITKILPENCTSCSADSKYFLKKGTGTQSLVTTLEKLFPNARIARADLDVTAKKKVWHEIIQKMHDNEIDILVGTQTIAKGLHFSNVTLVGIIWADLNVHFPIYNAAETTLQQLIQVAGRAGRAGQHSKVIVQTMGSHPIFNFINEKDYLQFYQKESEIRQLFSYPPFVRLVEIELKHTNEKIIDQEAQHVAVALRLYAKKTNSDITILGPSKPPVYKIQNRHSRKMYLKSKNMQHIISAYAAINKSNLQSKIFFTPNPMSL